MVFELGHRAGERSKCDTLNTMTDMGRPASYATGRSTTGGWGRGGVPVSIRTPTPVDDATTGIQLIEVVDDAVARVTADTAYDTVSFYEATVRRGATVVAPPARTATVSRGRPRAPARDHTITHVQQVGRRRWKKVSRYHRQARVQHLESDDRPRQASVVRDRSMRKPRLGTVQLVSESCTNAARARERVSGGRFDIE